MRNIWWLPGAAMIFLGVMIFIYPELLAFIVAAAFIGIGVTLITVGRNFRQVMTKGTSVRMYTSQQRPPNQIYYD